MSLSTSPRKAVPLASGDFCRPRKDPSVPKITRRVFYCGVVIEGSENGKRLPDDVQDLVLSLGNTISTERLEDAISDNSPSDSQNDIELPTQRKRALTDTSALASVINELVTSERSYVKRLQILKNDYADPLRNFARHKDTAIIPVYEAKTIFGNIDNLLPVNEAFLTDLEKMMAPNGSRTVGGVGDVALRHFKELRGFEQYKQYYVKREDAQHIFEREASKKSSRFSSYIDHIKYQSTDSRNRIGLRELLMEPVQRIPRYTLLFRNMLKHMAPDDPQRAKLTEADDIASKIALAEADEQTKRAAIFYCLTATIEDFPPDLFSNSRRFIDCIDVEDVLSDTSAQSAATSGSTSPLHCTLFLFDDKLVIAKRPGNGERGGRVLTGLDELDKVTKAGGIPIGKKKNGMTCKGVVDITEIVATDVGGTEMYFYLENPPQDLRERWSGRPLRSFFAVELPPPANSDTTRIENEKRRFLEHLWRAQAFYRARSGQSVVLCSDDQEVESRAGRATIARTYFNVYQRTAFLQEPRKTKIVVHIDQQGTADPIPFGIDAPPFARIRIQPLSGDLCRYGVSSTDPADEEEEEIVQTARVPSRIVHTIHQFGLFEFRTGKNSRPPTPTARSRVNIFGLDAISRNLFHTRPASAMGEFFGGSVNGHKRIKSTASRSSVYTQTTVTGDGSLMKFSHQSGSTAATSIIEEESHSNQFGSSRSRKLTKRGKSSTGSTSDSGGISPLRRSVLVNYRSRSVDRNKGDSDSEDDEGTLDKTTAFDPAELDLAKQLEIARRNSKNQQVEENSLAMATSIEPAIYEEEPSFLRPLSTDPKETGSTGSTSRPGSRTPTKALPESPTLLSRSPSPALPDRRPMGPRCPSPLPPVKVLPTAEMSDNISDDDIPVRQKTPEPQHPAPPMARPGALRRSKRQPFFPSNRIDSTPKALTSSSATTPVEPLSIKKKTSTRTSAAFVSPTPTRRTYIRHNSPLSRNSGKATSPAGNSPQLGKRKTKSLDASHTIETMEKLLHLSQHTSDEITSSLRSVKRIKVQVDDLQLPGTQHDPHPPSSLADGKLRTPQIQLPPMSKAAQERMEEMRLLINKRQNEGENSPRRIRTQSVYDSPVKNDAIGNVARSIEALASDVDTKLTRAASSQDALQVELKQVSNEFKEKMTELERSRTDLQNAKRQCELVKSLLADATAEKEIMYEAFNEELDGMYNDVNLPDDEAWAALSKDLKEAKETRNALSKENSDLRRQMAEIELQRDQWEALLRSHNLIP